MKPSTWGIRGGRGGLPGRFKNIFVYPFIWLPCPKKEMAREKTKVCSDLRGRMTGGRKGLFRIITFLSASACVATWETFSSGFSSDTSDFIWNNGCTRYSFKTGTRHCCHRAFAIATLKLPIILVIPVWRARQCSLRKAPVSSNISVDWIGLGTLGNNMNKVEVCRTSSSPFKMASWFPSRGPLVSW